MLSRRQSFASPTEVPISDEPESLVLQLLRDMREKMATKDDLNSLRAELKADMRSLQSDMHSLRADVASDLLTSRANMNGMRKELSDQIVGLRRAVIEYHTTFIGHGILISELEARLRRVEQHLSLDPMDTH